MMNKKISRNVKLCFLIFFTNEENFSIYLKKITLILRIISNNRVYRLKLKIVSTLKATFGIAGTAMPYFNAIPALLDLFIIKHSFPTIKALKQVKSKRRVIITSKANFFIFTFNAIINAFSI